MDAATPHLKHNRFQNLLVNRHVLDLPLVALLRSYFFHISSVNGLSIPHLPASIYSVEEEKQLLGTRRALVDVLADVSALPELCAAYPLTSPAVISLLTWLDAEQVQLQVCACIMLGNIARSDEACCELVHQYQVHIRLLKLLERTSDPQTLDAALGFLRNLSRPSKNKAVLDQEGTIEVVSRVWSMSVVPQIQCTSITITRLLVNDSMANIQTIMKRSSSDSRSPAYEKTYMTQLLSIYKKTDDLSTKLEIGRVITAIYRFLSTQRRTAHSETADSLSYRLATLHPDIGQPLAAMVLQSSWPIVRSEGWFALVLVARSRGGSTIVSGVMQQSEVRAILSDTLAVGTCGSASETSVGSDNESKERDKSNILILMDELTKTEVWRPLGSTLCIQEFFSV